MRLPAVQRWMGHRATAYLAQKTGADIQLKGLRFTYNGSVELTGLFVPDQQGDTLLYSGRLSAGIHLMPLYRGKISLKPIYWDNVLANVVQHTDSSFNFSYLLAAFTGESADKSTGSSEVVDKSDGSSLQLNLSQIDLRRIRLRYRSELNADDYQLHLQKLALQPEVLDLEKLRFGLAALVVNGMEAQLLTHPAPAAPETAEKSAAPWLSLKNVQLTNVKVYWEEAGIQSISSSLAALQLDEATVDLETEKINLGSLQSTGLALKMKTQVRPAEEAPTEQSPTETTPFSWPNWQYKLTALKLADYTISYREGDEPTSPAVFNPGDMFWQINQLELTDLKGKKQELQLGKLQLDVREKSGLTARATFALQASNQEARLENFTLETNNSQVAGKFRLNYTSVSDLAEKPLEQTLFLNLENGSRLSLKDALYFAPELATDSTLGPLVPWPLAFSGTLSGNGQELQFTDWQFAWGKASQIRFSASVIQPGDSLKRVVFVPVFALSTISHDLKLLTEADGYQYPEKLTMRASAGLDNDSIGVQIELGADGGSLSTKAEVNRWQDQNPAYKLQMQAKELHLGHILQDSLLGRAGWVSTLSGRGRDPRQMELSANVDFTQLQYQGYDYEALGVETKATAGHWEATINHQDIALGLWLHSTAKLDSIWPDYRVSARLDRADLQRLGFRTDPFELRFLLEASAQGTPDSLQTSLRLQEGLVVQEKLAYPLRQLDVAASISPSASALTLESDVVSGKFKANTGLDALLAAVTAELKAQWKLDSISSIDSSKAPILADANFKLHDSRFLQEVLLPGLTALDSAQFNFSFDQQQHALDVLVSIKNIDFAGTAVRNLFLDFEAEGGLKLHAGFDRLSQGEVDIHRTRLEMGVVDSLVKALFLVNDAAGRAVVRLQGEGGWRQANRYVSLHPDSTILNRQPWKADPDNRIILGERPVFSNFRLTNGQQQFSIQSSLNEIRVMTSDFPLAALTSLLNSDSLLATGALHGFLAVVGETDRSGLLANLKIADLAVLGQLLGDLKLETTMPAKNSYLLNAGVKGPEMELEVAGSYRTPASGAVLDMEIALNRLALKQFILLSDSAISDANGQMQGRLAINGPLSQLAYEGNLQFSNANLTIAAFNSSFGLGNKPIRFNGEGLVIDQFELTDENNQSLRLDGRIRTGGRPEALFDLRLKANDFRMLNSNRADNDLYFGQMRMNLDLNITGTPSKPVVDARARLNKGSKLSIIVPESQLDVVERDGVVIFSRVDPVADTLIDTQEQKTMAFLGLRLKALLEVDRESELVLIMDERSGDQLSVSGEANLKYDIYPNGLSSMTGVYEIRRGQYDLSLYELVKRKFELVPGGRIVWNGDVMDANLDLQALYRIKTSASDLMTAQLSGADESTRTRYRQELPFEVYMNIKGKLLKPDISFALDMPEQQRNALDGNVYARIQQLNQQESDLNKQVFSLMVLNRFVPDGSTTAGTGGATAMARSSVSQLLSSQLNSLSSQYVKGVDLNMDLDSYTDFSSGQARDRTQLNVNVRKSFLSDRLAVEVGRQVDVQGNPQASNDIIGDVSVEYRLSPDGAYRLRGFRRNQQEGLAEGPLVVTGMSLVLSREFNGFDELLRKKKETTTPEKPEDKP